MLVRMTKRRIIGRKTAGKNDDKKDWVARVCAEPVWAAGMNAASSHHLFIIIIIDSHLQGFHKHHQEQI